MITWKQIESAGRAQRERSAEALAERMAAFDAGLCSLAAAHAGGAEYERDRAETALELREANPVHAALNGWIAGQRIATPRYAAIGNGLFVRVGDGRKKRRAA